MATRKKRGSIPLDPNLLRKLLRYDPETGALIWRARPVEMFVMPVDPAEAKARNWNRRYAGLPAYGRSVAGYGLVGVLSNRLLAHRVAWAIYHGRWPDGNIDHINGVRDDNRIANLREVTAAENNRNMRRRSDNKSGVSGLFWHGPTRKWRVTIRDSGRQIYLGSFANREDAIAVRKAAERRYGYHPNHGRD